MRTFAVATLLAVNASAVKLNLLSWLTNDEDANEVYKFLSHNYVEDNDGVFRFDYPVDFLRWTLLTPGYNKEWHIGVRANGKPQLYGFISATKVKTHAHEQVLNSAKIERDFSKIHLLIDKLF